MATLTLASPARSDALDDFIRDQMERQHIPGLSLAVVKRGKTLKLKGYGAADLEHGTPVRTETVFQIQSMTKSFTAAGILLLAEEGKLRLEDPISKYFENTPESWAPITVRHLLNHTSGIKDFINEPVASLRLDITEEEVVRISRPRPLNFPPGERYSYSNTGYHLLGMIIRKLTGKPYGEFLKERIFDPLGMENTRVVSLSRLVPNRARGYLWNGAAVRNGEYIAASILGYAGGGLLSTTPDLVRWETALRSGRLLSKASMDEMWKRGRLNSDEETGYGLGWAIAEERERKVVSHTGSHLTGFTSAFLHFPEEELTVAVLTNMRGADPYRIAMGAARRSSAALMPPKRRPHPVSDAALDRCTGRYEIAVNVMLTVSRDEHGLYAGRPSGSGERLIPASESHFFGAESDNEYLFEGALLRLRTSGGEVEAPRIGPLFAQLEPSPVEPLVERRVRKALAVLGPGGDAVRYSQDLTAGARRDHTFGTPALLELKQLEILAAQEVAGRAITRSGSPVARIVYCRLTLEEGPVNALVHLTREGLVTDLDLVAL